MENGENSCVSRGLGHARGRFSSIKRGLYSEHETYGLITGDFV